MPFSSSATSLGRHQISNDLVGHYRGGVSNGGVSNGVCAPFGRYDMAIEVAQAIK
jgi:hypothetical protein